MSKIREPGGITRAKQLKELRAAADGDVKLLELLCSRLGLPWHYLPFALEALDEKFWAEAIAPFRYVASVARKKHLQWLRPASKGEELRLDDLGISEDNLTPDEDEWQDDDVPNKRDVLKALYPPIVKVTTKELQKAKQFERLHGIPLGARPAATAVDWSAVARDAGLDEAETRVLVAKSTGEGRTAAMASCANQEAILAVQAAWRRFERSIQPRIQDFLQRKYRENVPGEHFADT